MATKTPEFEALMVSAVVEYVDAISGVATRRDVLVEVTTRQFQLTTKRIRLSCHVLSLVLLVSSSSLEVVLDDTRSIFCGWSMVVGCCKDQYPRES